MKKKEKQAPVKSELIIYQTEDGETKVEVRLQDETVWLTQKLMAELFQTTPQNITIHLRNIFTEGELEEGATCKDFLQVQTEGSRRVERIQRFWRWQRRTPNTSDTIERGSIRLPRWSGIAWRLSGRSRGLKNPENGGARNDGRGAKRRKCDNSQ